MREELSRAIDFAIKTGSFSAVNACKSAKNVCVFGLGRFFEEAFDTWGFKDAIGVNVLCDNNPDKWGKVFKGLLCVPFEELVKLDDLIVIPLVGDNLSVIKQLQESNIRYILPTQYIFERIANTPRDTEWFSRNRILNVYDMLADEESKRIYASALCNRIAFGQYLYSDLCIAGEYFSVPDIYELRNDEVFVDCGAYTGDTIIRFIESLSFLPKDIRRFKEIHAFEADIQNFRELEKTIASISKKYETENIFCYHVAVWNESGTLAFGREEFGSYEGVCVNKAGDVFIKQTVPAVRIDDIVKNATFIKMDNEGAELNALRGAENTIKNNAPKLAICIYHQLNDFWEIPIYLSEIMPEYKFFVRHHQNYFGGTVLYARK
jgi:FkbM family methyltransferase